MTSHRRGFTLVELIMGLVLTLMVGGVTYMMLLNNHRVSRAQQAHVTMQDNVRSGAMIIGAELREVGYDRLPNPLNAVFGAAIGAPGAVRSDLVAFGADSVRYKAMRGFGIVCGLDAGTSQVVVEAASLQLNKTPSVSDSVMLYVEDDPGTADDDLWVHAGITAFTPNQNCASGAAGSAVTVSFPVGVAAGTVFGLMSMGAPVRLFDEMVLRTYQSGGDAWLGMRSETAGGVIEPVLGPLSNGVAGTAGLGFRWLDMNGAVTAVPTDARSVEITLRSISDAPVHLNGQSHQGIDSLPLTTQVALRNALR